MITVTFNCDGCDAVAPGTTFLASVFHSINGKGHGFGHWERASVESVCPDGWVAFDPYTQCVYCPDCWAEIDRATADGERDE